MSITDELRKWFKDRLFMGNGYAELTAIADRIDAEHQKAIRELNNLADASVLLPVDADGVPIRVGDVLTDNAESKSEGKVMRFMFDDEGWAVGLDCGWWAEPSIHEWHHHHAPTIDDLLFSYGQACIRASNEAETDAAKQTMLTRLREDYATKLRLADDGEELED